MKQIKSETFSIGDTAKIAGVSQKQLRNWEARGYIAPPIRVVCGQRAYRYFTKRQVDAIKKIKDYLDQGYALPHAARMARAAFIKEGKGNDA